MMIGKLKIDGMSSKHGICQSVSVGVCVLNVRSVKMCIVF